MNEDYLSHHGIKGQKWGIRRYQNPDGSLTDAGMKRYRKAEKIIKKESSNFVKNYQKAEDNAINNGSLFKQLRLNNKYIKNLERYKDAEDFIKELGKTPMSVLEDNPQYKYSDARSPYQDPYNVLWMLGPDNKPIAGGPTSYQKKHYAANGRKLQGYRVV